MDLLQDLNHETVERAELAEAFCVTPEVPVRDVLEQLKQRNTGCVLVCEEGKLVGIFTERDALKLLAEDADLDVPIGQVMVRNPMTLPSSATMAEAITRMSSGGYRRMPIVDGQGRPLGLLKVSGILRYLVQYFPNLVYTLPPMPHHTLQDREGA